MSKRRVPNSERPASRAGKPNPSGLGFHRFAGVSIGGGKNSKTVIAVLDYYPDLKRLALSYLIDTIKPEDEISGDDSLLEALAGLGPNLDTVAVDAPLTFPRCMTCELVCPGVARCQEEHILWFWKSFRERKARKKNTRLFTPYTQRPVEAWLSELEEEVFHPSDALGANTAPLAARMRFLLKRLKGITVVEVFPKLSLWRIGRNFKIMKRHLRFHKHSVEGDKSRLHILHKLIDHEVLFIYQQDMAKLVQNGHAFDSLICALTGYYRFLGKTEKRPEGFPKVEGWIEIPHLENT